MIKSIQNFFNINIYYRIISGIFFTIPFIFAIINGGIFFVLFFTLLLIITIDEFNLSTRNKIRTSFKIFISLIFIISFFHFIFLRIASEGNIIEYLIYIIFSIWIFDSFSLIGGRLIGGKKLMPSISPNKTISGFLTGFVSIFVFSIINMILFNQEIIIILSTLIIGLISFIGDAIGSYCKRFLQIKDFSNLMPGHGGILDRMDAFILFFLIHFILSIFISNPINLYA